MTAPHIQARPTIYKGVQMRSRLEAAFAQFLDNHTMAWVYEPNAYGSDNGQYLPDFVVATSSGSSEFYEVKPMVADFDEALARMHIVLDSDPGAYLAVATSTDYEHFTLTRTCRPGKGCGQCERTRGGPLGDLIKPFPWQSNSSVAACGQCGAEWTHLVAIEPYSSSATDNRLSVALTFSCEECPMFTRWHLDQHKGQTLLGFETSPWGGKEET